MSLSDAERFSAFEAAGWEERAAAYERFFAAVTGRVAEFLLDAAGARAGRRLLDVGTGPGIVAAAAAERGADVVGIDVADAMVALARRLHPELDVRRGDAEHLLFADDTFDAVVANLVILHLARPEQAAAEMARVVAPGGRVALSVWDTPDRGRLVGVFAEAMASVSAAPPEEVPPGPPFFRFSDDGEFARLLTDVGLRDVQVRTVTFSHHVATLDELWDGVVEGTVRTRATILAQPADVRARIRRAFERLMAAHAADGGFAVPVSAKVVSGEKRR